MSYKHFGAMIDCSRNGVMKVEEIKRFIDYIVAFGYDTLELYSEDVYQLKDEPWFGYLRGGYTGDEIKEIDAYAKEKGVELIPCVQTLGHFYNLTKLGEYASITDVSGILLIDEQKTYELIEKIIANCAENFSSRNIHIGMDEAHMVGLGRYLDKHGYTNRFDLLNRHLSKVNEIVKKYGFTPQMWSDMYFRLANNGNYCGKDLHIDKEVRDKVPKNVELVYWDYYATEKEDYDAMIASHKEFGNKIWFAGGAWSWFGFAPMNYLSLKTMKPAMQSVRENGIQNVLITLWGDDGKECSYFSLLPSLYAIRQFADGNFDQNKIAEDFKKITGFNYSDFMLLDILNSTKPMLNNGQRDNPSKLLLYTDCFMGLFDDEVEKEGKIDYADFAAKLNEAKTRVGKLDYVFTYLADLANVMAIKYDLGVRTRRAYLAKDKNKLSKIIDEYVELKFRIEIFHKSFRELWFKENKPYGWELHDIRLGGLIKRVQTCKERLVDYIEGRVDKIEELENKIMQYQPWGLGFNSYRLSVSPSGF